MRDEKQRATKYEVLHRGSAGLNHIKYLVIRRTDYIPVSVAVNQDRLSWEILNYEPLKSLQGIRRKQIHT